MKKTLMIIVPMLVLATLGYAYYWYRNNPLFAYKYRSDENRICEEKCRIIFREDLKQCGDKCFTGFPSYTFDKKSNKCLYTADIISDNYYDFYIKDCNTNEYITRWHPSPEEFKTSNGKELTVMNENASLLKILISDQAEVFLLSQ